MVVVEDGITLPLSLLGSGTYVQGGELATTSVRGAPHRKPIDLPSFLCPRLFSGPCPQTVCAQVIGSPSAIVLLCFLSKWWLGFKTTNLIGPSKVQTHSPPPAMHQAPFCPRKEVAWSPRCLIYGKAQQKAATRLSALWVCLCPLL